MLTFYGIKLLVVHRYSVIVALTGLPIGYSVIVALTGLPIGYCVIVALTGLPIGYSVIVALTDLPIGYSVIVAPYRIQCNSSSNRSPSSTVIGEYYNMERHIVLRVT